MIGRVCAVSRFWSIVRSLEAQCIPAAHTAQVPHAAAVLRKAARYEVTLTSSALSPKPHHQYNHFPSSASLFSTTTTITTSPSLNQSTAHHATPSKHHSSNTSSLHVPREHGLLRGLRRVVHAQGARARAGGGYRRACEAGESRGRGEGEVGRSGISWCVWREGDGVLEFECSEWYSRLADSIYRADTSLMY